mmetsp:Transcript_3584/g.4967  ORF Transcript_3584/g.4967 Transcript_3584/m.4967 type:complete len:371 (-) Transcript_3584:43-1155(-)
MKNHRKQKRLDSFFDYQCETANSIFNSKKQKSYANVAYSNCRFDECPICTKSFPSHALARHAENCLLNLNEKSIGPKPKSKITSSSAPDELGSKKITNQNSNDTVSKQSLEEKKDGPELCSKRSLSYALSSNKSKWDSLMKQQDTKGRKVNIIAKDYSSEPFPGLYVYEDFISSEEEQIIIDSLDGKTSTLLRDPFKDDNSTEPDILEWKPSRFNGSHFGKRWGVHCNLRERKVTVAETPLPGFMRSIILPQLSKVLSPVYCAPNEANAIDYRRRKGHHLQNHVDDRQLSKEPIANLSLAGDCFMTYINEKIKPTFTSMETEAHRVLLKRRTLQILTGKARYDYSHGIRNDDFLSDRRISITMRESPLTE